MYSPKSHSAKESIVNEIMVQANTDQVCLMLVSSGVSPKNAYFLFRSGIDPQLINIYRRELLSSDPHINDSQVALTSCSSYSNVIHLEDTRNNHSQKQKDRLKTANKYNDCLAKNGIYQTAIYSKRLTRSTFISVGLLSENRSHRIRLDESKNCIQEWIDIYCDELLSDGLRYRDASVPVSHDLTAVHKLTRREWEVSENVCLGLSNKQIAYKLELSENTIENHLRNIYKKLAVHNRTSLVATINHH